MPLRELFNDVSRKRGRSNCVSCLGSAPGWASLQDWFGGRCHVPTSKTMPVPEDRCTHLQSWCHGDQAAICSGPCLPWWSWEQCPVKAQRESCALAPWPAPVPGDCLACGTLIAPWSRARPDGQSACPEAFLSEKELCLWASQGSATKNTPCVKEATANGECKVKSLQPQWNRNRVRAIIHHLIHISQLVKGGLSTV